MQRVQCTKVLYFDGQTIGCTRSKKNSAIGAAFQKPALKRVIGMCVPSWFLCRSRLCCRLVGFSLLVTYAYTTHTIIINAVKATGPKDTSKMRV